MRQRFVMVEDIDLRDVDDTAYKFEGCTDLADEDKAVIDIDKMRSLANAGEYGLRGRLTEGSLTLPPDTFTYFLCGKYPAQVCANVILTSTLIGLYMDACNWSDGFCRNPATVD